MFFICANFFHYKHLDECRSKLDSSAEVGAERLVPEYIGHSLTWRGSTDSLSVFVVVYSL